MAAQQSASVRIITHWYMACARRTTASCEGTPCSNVTM
jgi:hypothetical protein